MTQQPLPQQKRIALIAHDGRKKDLLEWIKFNRESLSKNFLFATGTTGETIGEETGLAGKLFLSGPLGGDQQIGAKIAEDEINILIFFWDPLEPQPHDPDVKALLRLAVLHNIPTASNRSTANFLITSNLITETYPRFMLDYSARSRKEKDNEECNN
jgi:methylglyoxal synthase